MKRTTTIAALMLTIAGPAYAERPSGWQAMGCDDPTQFRAVRSADTGAVLYWNNPTCSDPFSGEHEVPATQTQTPTRTAGGNVTENRGQNNGASGPEQGTGPDIGGRGNASANNGRGGNYDRTGQTDNGRGNGRNR